MTASPGENKRQCSLLLFLATPAKEAGLESATTGLELPFEKVRDPDLGAYRWLGRVGNEVLIAVSPTRRKGRVVMGSTGRLGSAAKAIRFQQATGAQGIIQIGMAFGILPDRQKLGDVLVSTSLIPYDNRDVKPDSGGVKDYIVDYTQASKEPARDALVQLFQLEQSRGGHPFKIHLGAILSGAARIHTKRFRDELVSGVPDSAEIVGGEMEGVGLLAASTSDEDPIWCVVKGISAFADEERDNVIREGRSLACANAANFVLKTLINDASA